MRKSEELHMTVEVDENIHVSADSFFFTLFGMSVEALSKELRDDKNLEYDGIITNLIAV